MVDRGPQGSLELVTPICSLGCWVWVSHPSDTLGTQQSQLRLLWLHLALTVLLTTPRSPQPGLGSRVSSVEHLNLCRWIPLRLLLCLCLQTVPSVLSEGGGL